MDPVTNIYFEIQQIKTQLERMILTGTVTAVHAGDGLVDVTIDDEIVLEKIPFYTTRAGADKTYWMPSVGEHGTVFSPGGNLGLAMFLPALNSAKNPVPETDENLVVRVWEDGAKESYDKGKHEYVFQINAETFRKMIRGEIVDEVGSSKQTVDATKVKHEVGSNIEELTAIVLNLIGAHFFPSGLTTLQSPVGPCFFAPTPTPVTPPNPPVGSSPNSDGEVTQTPPTTIRGVEIQAVSNIDLTLTSPVPVVVGGTAGTIVTGTQISGTARGTLNLRLPARAL